MGRFLNPFTDWGFKRLFGQEPSKDILIALLNSLLRGEHFITDVTFLNKEQQPDSPDNRGVIYDVYCLTDKGEHIIVEMQNQHQSWFSDRALYYISRAICEQGRRGDWEYDLTAVYGIFFMNFKSSAFEPKLRTDVALADKETGRPFSQKMRMIFLQLPYFQFSEEDCQSDFDCFIYIITRMKALERMPFTKRNAIYERIAQMADITTLTKEEHRLYDQSIKHYRDYMAVKRTAEREAMAEGRNQAKTEIVRKLAAMGIPHEQIAEATGWDIETVKAQLKQTTD